MSLRGRLISFALTLTIANGLLFVVLWGVVQMRVVPVTEHYLEQRTVGLTKTLARQLDVGLAAEDPGIIKNALRGISSEPDLVSVVVRTDEGRAIGELKGEGKPGERDLVSTEQIVFEGVPLGSVTVTFSTRRIAALTRVLVVLVLVALAILIISILASLHFSQAFVAPIRRMMEFCRSVASGDFEQQLNIHGATEVENLRDHLTQMSNDLREREVALEKRRHELEASLQRLRETQDELVDSTRLASLGEMAGRTAHEVLNPMTSMHGRLTKISDELEDITGNVDALKAVVSGWEDVYYRGGVDALASSLKQPVSIKGRSRPLLEEDLHVLKTIAKSFFQLSVERKNDYQFLLRQVDRVVRIVDGMRSLARSKGTPELIPVDELLLECLEVIRDNAEKQSIDVVFDAFEGGGAVRVDRYEFIQILSNLLRNAMLAIEERSGREGGRIHVSAKVVDGRVEIRVRDSGTGISSENLPMIFDSSFTTRGANGTGLGLGIARRLARQFQGDLVVEDTTVGVGTTFMLHLPNVPSTLMVPEDTYAPS